VEVEDSVIEGAIESKPCRGDLSADRVAIVTGGAGGIGRATTLALAARGASVLAVDLD
jgi:Mrp family chromosome partitioning ATPase